MKTPESREREHAERMLKRAQRQHARAAKLVEKWQTALDPGLCQPEAVRTRLCVQHGSIRELNVQAAETGYGKAEKQKPLSNFPTATTTTKCIQLWDTDSRGKFSSKGTAASDA